MTIDIHAHTVPEAFIEELRGTVPEAAPRIVREDDGWWFEYGSGRRSGPIPAGMFDTEARLADMDRLGIQVHALSVPPPHFHYRLAPEAAAEAARLHNAAMLGMARAHPERFVVLGHLPMQSEEHALAELARLVADPAVVGLELGTNVAGVNLGDPAHDAVWRAIDAAGLAVVLHPGADVAGADRMHDHYLHNFVGNPTDTTIAAGSLMFSGVLSRNRALRFGLLHGGGFLPYQIGRFDHGWEVRSEPREQLDVPPSTLLDRFWFDTLTHDAHAMRFLLERVGPDRLCLGSDYPFDMADADPVASVRAALDERPEVIERVLHENARELLTRRPA
ncbi:amidohydrolase family protein [Homoserinibacter sp. YIM 151385]|uniref:amidohydrolase family protein n=1 Tax=Homoserinibacter sp. YIM 151385 TaxID=2985506 RepID=UPI0022F13C3F|nr:amidohydrolase family protein [Homoserinibacter sp. YIM 151385]WBU37093.1 amidohydrolase family protein [Homoserinibacter sp. YIM 151385]